MRSVRKTKQCEREDESFIRVACVLRVATPAYKWRSFSLESRTSSVMP